MRAVGFFGSAAICGDQIAVTVPEKNPHGSAAGQIIEPIASASGMRRQASAKASSEPAARRCGGGGVEEDPCARRGACAGA